VSPLRRRIDGPMASPIIGILEHSILLSIANENFKLFRGLRGLESDGDIWCVGLKDATVDITRMRNHL